VCVCVYVIFHICAQACRMSRKPYVTAPPPHPVPTHSMCLVAISDEEWQYDVLQHLQTLTLSRTHTHIYTRTHTHIHTCKHAHTHHVSRCHIEGRIRCAEFGVRNDILQCIHTHACTHIHTYKDVLQRLCVCHTYE